MLKAPRYLDSYDFQAFLSSYTYSLPQFSSPPLLWPKPQTLQRSYPSEPPLERQIENFVRDRNAQLRNKVIVGSRFPSFHIAGNQYLDVLRNTALGEIVINGASG